MKRQLIVLLLLTTSLAWADCPDLSGTYTCEENIFGGSGDLKIEKSLKNGIEVFTFDGQEAFVVDGKLKVEEWSVPGSAGGLMLMQFACEDDSLVVRIGLNLGFIEEKRFSKGPGGSLVQEAFRVELNGPEDEQALFGDMTEAAEKISDETNDRNEAMKLLTALIVEKAPAAWKKAKDNGLAQSVRVECQKKF